MNRNLAILSSLHSDISYPFRVIVFVTFGPNSKTFVLKKNVPLNAWVNKKIKPVFDTRPGSITPLNLTSCDFYRDLQKGPQSEPTPNQTYLTSYLPGRGFYEKAQKPARQSDNASKSDLKAA